MTEVTKMAWLELNWTTTDDWKWKSDEKVTEWIVTIGSELAIELKLPSWPECVIKLNWHDWEWTDMAVTEQVTETNQHKRLRLNYWLNWTSNCTGEIHWSEGRELTYTTGTKLSDWTELSRTTKTELSDWTDHAQLTRTDWLTQNALPSPQETPTEVRSFSLKRTSLSTSLPPSPTPYP